jgi:pyruvate/2-oxoglutarate/acetoin dehydrogenase E1 component
MSSRTLTYVKAFNEGMHQLMAADPDVFLCGEDVAGYGGVFHMFDGLLDSYGPRRVFDTPISEQAIIGLGTGAAARGLRPVCDLMFMDFLGVCMDQVANQAAKMKYMYGGTVSVPLTITTAGGAGMSAAAQHSQSLEAWLAHIPGLKVVMPATPYDAKGLIVSAVRTRSCWGSRARSPRSSTRCRSGRPPSCAPAPTSRSWRSAAWSRRR